MSGFTALVTQGERVLVTRDGRTVAVLAGQRAELSRAADEDARRLVLARAIGNYKRGSGR